MEAESLNRASLRPVALKPCIQLVNAAVNLNNHATQDAAEPRGRQQEIRPPLAIDHQRELDLASETDAARLKLTGKDVCRSTAFWCGTLGLSLRRIQRGQVAREQAATSGSVERYVFLAHASAA